MRQSILLFVVVVALLAEITSCGGGSSAPPPPPPTVSISPFSASVQTQSTTQFMATVTGTTNTAVTWEVDGITGGSISVGTISGTGSTITYQAPESVPVNTGSGQATTVTVTAVSQADMAISASATVTVTSANQLSQNLPIELGTSGGNVNNIDATECASGTLGSLLVRNGTQFILSNNHVLADEDTGTVGQNISQPGLIDTPSPCTASETNTVAHLSQFVELEQPAGCITNCTPPVDAAIAQIVSGAVDTTGGIIQLGSTTNGSGVPTNEAPSATVFPSGSIVPNTTAVAKSGRSTGLTCSTVEATDVEVSIDYTHGLGGSQFTATYNNQVIVNSGSFSAAGDSGSLIVAQANAEPIALLYGGNSTSTAGNPVATVLANLGDTSTPQNFPTFVGTSDHVVDGCTSTGTDAFDATAQAAAPAPSAAQVSSAEAAENQNAPALLSDPAVLALGVADSLDRVDRAAVVLFVRKGQTLVRAIPHNVGGVPTRVIRVSSLSQTGVLNYESSAALVKSAGPQPPANPTPAELAAAKSVKEKYAASLMKQPGMIGVGVTSSLDNPGEAAILIFVETGKTTNPIPLELDGIRVHVKTTDRFRAYGWGHPKPHQ